MTEHDTYIIRSSGAGWAVCLTDKTLGVFGERPEAIQAAVVVAESSGRSGRASEVLAEEENGSLLRIWEVGRDAYSPLT
jgi:hypothetical protein